jgi:hypothetical protein
VDATDLARVRSAWANLPRLRQDSIFYLVSAIFAVLITVFTTGDYQVWGEIAIGPYLAGALTSELRYRHELHITERTARRAIMLAVFAGVVLAPLGCLVVWQAEALAGFHAQVEVGVIEAAGDRALHGHDPYLAAPSAVGVNMTSDNRTVDANTYFTYLPAMVPFGMSNDLPGPAELGDARLVIVGFTLVVGLFTIIGPASVFGRRARVLQVLLVLPTGALPLVTGGDDLPVLAMMLLSVVLAARRRPVLSGLAMGVAGAMKLIAWPLLALLAFSQRDRDGRPARFAYAATCLSLLVPAVLVGFVPDPQAFYLNVFKFPLGLAKVKSPASSPLLGEALTSLFPGERHLITGLLVLAGVMVVVAVLYRWPPHSPASAVRLTAFALALATLLSPATRFGYLIYPANLLVWASMIETGPEQDTPEHREGDVSLSRRPAPDRPPSPRSSPAGSGLLRRARA